MTHKPHSCEVDKIRIPRSGGAVNKQWCKEGTKLIGFYRISPLSIVTERYSFKLKKGNTVHSIYIQLGKKANRTGRSRANISVKK